MRLPKIPPTTAELYDDLPQDRARAAFQAGVDAMTDGRYLHWDELLRRLPPAGLTHAQWWFGIKLARASPRSVVPLESVDGITFDLMATNLVQERLHEIDLSLGGSISMPSELANPEQKDRYYVSSLIEEAITSSQLEGATTTRRVAAEMLRAGRPPRDRSERMIMNNYSTMKRIGELKTERLTPEIVFDLHRLVTTGALDDETAAGRFRRSDENVVVADEFDNVFHVPPPADQLTARMDAMCRFANGDTPSGFLHPVLRAIVLHFWLAYDHPFVDGNGRTARALFYWSMLHSRYWLFEFVSISQILLKAPVRYSRSFLHTETDGGDLTYFVLHHLNVIHRAVKALHEYIARKSTELKELRRRLSNVDQLNYRQQALMEKVLSHPFTQYTVESHQRSHNVVYQTARVDLLDLVQRGYLEKKKVGKKLVFTAVADFQEKLGG
jgi:Fic family protein